MFSMLTIESSGATFKSVHKSMCFMSAYLVAAAVSSFCSSEPESRVSASALINRWSPIH